uniref:Uncharacterized protein n=1 Tax=Arundo donax TaxID=35708 RepID=A0A0A9CWF1_ARUDO
MECNNKAPGGRCCSSRCCRSSRGRSSSRPRGTGRRRPSRAWRGWSPRPPTGPTTLGRRWRGTGSPARPRNGASPRPLPTGPPPWAIAPASPCHGGD